MLIDDLERQESVLAVHTTETALAVVCAPQRLILFGAGECRRLFEGDLPGGSRLCSEVALSECAEWVAWSTAGAQGAGALWAARMPTLGGIMPDAPAAPLREAALLAMPAGEVRALLWVAHAGVPPRLLCGDACGELRVWASAAASRGAVAASAAVVWREDAPVVQLDADDHLGLLLVSTWTRSVLLPLRHVCDADEGALSEIGARQIGQASRDGPYGACFLREVPVPLPTAALAAARPGRRLWLVSGVSDVLATLRLPQPPATDGATPPRGALCLGRIAALRHLGVLLSWGETAACGCVAIVDPRRARVLATWQLDPPVRAAVCVGCAEAGAEAGAGAGAGSAHADATGRVRRVALELLALHGAPRRLAHTTLTLDLADLDGAIGGLGAGPHTGALGPETSAAPICAPAADAAALDAQAADAARPGVRFDAAEVASAACGPAVSHPPRRRAARIVRSLGDGDGTSSAASSGLEPVLTPSGGVRSWAEGLAMAEAEADEGPATWASAEERVPPQQPAPPAIMSKAAIEPPGPPPPRWLRADRPATALAVLLVRSVRWVAAAFELCARRLRPEQWPPLLALARAVDLAPSASARDGSATLVVVGAMAEALPASTLLPVLQRAPWLVDAMPIEGYATLLSCARGSGGGVGGGART